MPPATTRDLKYARLAEDLRRQIETGVFKPGDQLPSYARMLATYGIRQNTAEKMYAVLEQDGLVVREPNRGTFVAPPKRRTATGVIGLSTGPTKPRQHPYYTQLLASIRDAAHAAHLEIVLLHDESHVGLDKLDGILISHWHLDRTLHRWPAELPVVSLVHPCKDVSCVIADESVGIRAAVELLLQLGHRRIAYLTCGAQEWVNTSAKERMAAYRDTLEKAGIAPLNRWARPVYRPFEPLKSFEETGYDRIKQWIEEDWRELGCTALLAHNDDAAMGAIDAFQAAGIRVPEEVSVIGFDGTDFAAAFRPRLTTVEMPLDEIGAAGVKLLSESIALGAAPRARGTRTIVLPTRLRVRDSTVLCPARSKQLEAVLY